jgi:2-oxoisovalerate dehydrogenase E2 component (dihydrolipoyl transacylase)
MAQTVTMPQLGESVTEGTIARWLKQPGESVERYESIAEVVTDKVNAEIPSPIEGVMGRHVVEEGAVVPVGQPICEIEAAGAAGGAAPGEAAGAEAAAQAPAPAAEAPAPAPAEPAAASQPAPAAAPAASVQPPPGGASPSVRTGAAAQQSAPPPEPAPPAAAPPAAPPAPAGNGGGASHVTPAVRMLAREHGVDLAELSGSGLGGRVTKKDVLEFVQRRDAGAARPAASAPAPAPSPAAPPPPAPAAPAAVPAGAVPEQLAGDTLVPLTPQRRAIAEHMVRSKATSPHAWTMVEVDMSAVVASRARHRAAFEQATGVNLTFLPFVARATIAALRQFPTLNASFTPDGIVLKRDIHLGIAVALEDSLIVPVIRNADRLSLAGLAEAARDLGERARAGHLKLDEIQGGTFTLNNTGALGTVLTAPIINQPQAAILAMDTIVKRPVVVEGDAIAIRSMMNLCISFDHRVNDGLKAVRFLRAVKDSLEAVDETAPLG